MLSRYSQTERLSRNEPYAGVTYDLRRQRIERNVQRHLAEFAFGMQTASTIARKTAFRAGGLTGSAAKLAGKAGAGIKGGLRRARIMGGKVLGRKGRKMLRSAVRTVANSGVGKMVGGALSTTRKAIGGVARGAMNRLGKTKIGSAARLGFRQQFRASAYLPGSNSQLSEFGLFGNVRREAGQGARMGANRGRQRGLKRGAKIGGGIFNGASRLGLGVAKAGLRTGSATMRGIGKVGEVSGAIAGGATGAVRGVRRSVRRKKRR